MINATIVNTLTPSQKKNLLNLYHNEWWTNARTEEDIDRIFSGSTFVVGLTHPETNELIAFCRVLTDQFSFAYIYDVIVHQNYRKQGLGDFLMTTVLADPRIKDLKSVELVCRKEMSSFYERFGFSKDYGLSVSMRKGQF